MGHSDSRNGQDFLTGLKNGMVRLVSSRRTMTALLAIICLTILGLVNKVDTSLSIAGVAMGMAGSNAFQKKGQQPNE